MSREVLQQALELYLSREMPAGTVIGDPKWWAPKIAAAFETALAQPIPQAVPQIPQEHSSDEMEAVYEAIIQWDEGGGKRSRRELARRIVAANIGTWSGLTSQRQPLTDIEIVEALMPVNVFGDGYHLRIARAIEAAIGIKAVA